MRIFGIFLLFEQDDACTNSRVAGDLRRYHAHVTSLLCELCVVLWCKSEMLFAMS